MRIPMSSRFSLLLAIAACFWVAACSDGPPSNAEHSESGSSSASESPGEHGEAEEGAGERGGSEGEGEHGASEGEGEHRGSEGEGEHGGTEGEGEHGEGGGHDSGEEGEESGVYIGMSETWDATRRGARLVLAFDTEKNAFVGSVENTTQETICAVRVEVHLSGGTELGPTERADLPPGQSIAVELATGGEAFDAWTAHPESSPCGRD